MEKQSLSSQTFYDALLGSRNNAPIKFNGAVFEDTIIIQGKVRCKVIAHHCTFHLVSFKNLLELTDLEFHNCTFLSSLTFDESKETRIQIAADKYPHIEFLDCTFSDVKFSRFNTQCKIKFLGNSVTQSKIKELRIFNLNSLNSIVFSEVEISDLLRMQTVTLDELTFERSKISADSMSKDINTTFLTISKCEIVAKRFLLKLVKCFEFKIVKNRFNSPFLLDNLWIDLRLDIYNNEFYDTVGIGLSKQVEVHVAELNLNGNNSVDNFIIAGKNKSKITKLNHFSNGVTRGAILVKDIDIEVLTLNGSNTNGTIVYEGIQVSTLNIIDFYNNSQLALTNVSINSDSTSNLNISNSQLGKAKFSNLNLDSFQTISINNSDFSNLKTSNIKWFNLEKLDVSFEEQREIYRQIKFIYEKQGDRINSLKFKAYELTAYRNELFKNVATYKWPFNKERFILLTSWASNNFGLSWTRPIAISFFVVLIFWILISIEVSPKLTWHFSPQNIENTFSELWGHSSAFWQLFNPTHRISSIYKKNPDFGGLAHFLSFTLKLIMAYLIFQTVSAFRKYSK